MTVLVTGATGFVGRALLTRMLAEGSYAVRAVVRRESATLSPAAQRVVADLGGRPDWSTALLNVHAVVHLAARVHVMRDRAPDPLSEYRRVNVTGTLYLARQAAVAGVKRFVYLSSVKVNGETGRYVEDDPAAPQDPYSVSKHEAEEGLRRVTAETGMESVVIRSPLVYGPGVGANFGALMRWVDRGLPLPLGAIRNRRSLVAVDNLVDFLLVCLNHPAAANEIFFVSDGEDLPTPALVRRMATAMGRPSRLIPVPPGLLMAAAAIAGRLDIARRLTGTLQVDTTKARRLLGWTPPVAVDDALRRAVARSA